MNNKALAVCCCKKNGTSRKFALFFGVLDLKESHNELEVALLMYICQIVHGEELLSKRSFIFL